jgi:spore maturation protein CgeB
MVFAGEFWRGSSGLGLAEGFRACGWAVQEIDIGRFRPNLGATAPARAMRRILEPISARAFRSTILDACRSLKPDVFLSIKGTWITADLLGEIKSTGARSGLFYPDVHFDHPGVDLETLGAFDKFITTKSFHSTFLSARFGAGKIAYVPHGYASGIHQPLYGALNESEYDADIQHIGAFSPYKLGWLSTLHERLPHARLRIVGPGWTRRQASTLSRAAISGVPFENVAYSAALQTARINVAVHFGPVGPGWQDLVSTRTFEIPACRGFMLHIDNEEVREFFTPGREIDVFASPEELVDKVRFYLTRPDLRAAMIERAYSRCVPAYSYDMRARQIIDILQS